MTEPYPCECGAADVGPVVEQVEDDLWQARVECPDCETVGPERSAPEPDEAEREAIRDWNAWRAKQGVGDP